MFWKPIVVGVDGSPESIRAAALAWKIAQAARADYWLVHTVPDVTFGGGLGPAPVTSPELQERLVEDATVQIRAALQGAVPPSVLDTLLVRVGRAGIVLAREASARDAELVVLGGKHHGAVGRALGGSTAHFLVRSLDVPLLVTGPSARPVTRVLVAVDLSYASAPAIEEGRRLAQILGARLRVMHAVEPVRMPLAVPVKVDVEDYYRRSVQALERLAGAVPGLDPRDRPVRRGPAAETVAAEVADWEADLLVVGSHGRGWVDRLMVGSTTERLLNLQPTSLVVVPVSPGNVEPREVEAAAGSRPRTRKQSTKGGIA